MVNRALARTFVKLALDHLSCLRLNNQRVSILNAAHIALQHVVGDDPHCLFADLKKMMQSKFGYAYHTTQLNNQNMHVFGSEWCAINFLFC